MLFLLHYHLFYIPLDKFSTKSVNIGTVDQFPSSYTMAPRAKPLIYLILSYEAIEWRLQRIF